jgi:hypothetical protein
MLAVKLIIGVISGMFFPTNKPYSRNLTTITLLSTTGGLAESLIALDGAEPGVDEYINQIVIGWVTTTKPAKVWLSARSSVKE